VWRVSRRAVAFCHDGAMTIPEIPADFADLLEIPVATLATVGPSGYPQASAVWFLYEDGRIKTSIHESRQKFRNAVRTGKATWLFVDPANPYRTLEIRGDVSVEEDYPALDFMRRQFVKYGTTPEEFQGEKDEGRKVLVVTPVRVRTWG